MFEITMDGAVNIRTLNEALFPLLRAGRVERIVRTTIRDNFDVCWCDGGGDWDGAYEFVMMLLFAG